MSKSIKSENKVKGDFGEKIVDKYLIKSGYKILAKNFKCHLGEIDTIFKDEREIVFAEIKTRKGIKYGFPIEVYLNDKMSIINHIKNVFW